MKQREYSTRDIGKFCMLGFHRLSIAILKKGKRFSMSFDLKHWWNLVLYFFVVVVVAVVPIAG